MKKLLSIILSLLIVVSAIGTLPALAEESTTPGTYLDLFKQEADLVWNDEFEGDKVDTTKWDIQKGWGRFTEIWGSEEDGNVSVSDGCLKLRAFKKFTSGDNGKRRSRIQSGEVNSRAAWSDGLIEIRAKLPKGHGVYPAIWTMGRDYSINSCLWPWSGEVDIMEAVGQNNTDAGNWTTWQTLHSSRPYSINGNANAAHYSTPIGEYGTPHQVPLNDDFHTFWLYLDGSILLMGVDDAMFTARDLTKEPNLDCYKFWEQWLILGLQMGGVDGEPQRTDYSVWEMLIDYVRVYRLKDLNEYKKYKIIEAESLEYSGINTTNYTVPIGPNCVANPAASDLTLYLEDIEAGNYDVYVNYITSGYGGTYNAYINGEKSGVFSINSNKTQLKCGRVGKVTLEENCDFQLKFDYVSGDRLYIDKVFLVKTEEKGDIVINKSNAVVPCDYFEVSSAAELENAISSVKSDGTIKLKKDITMTNSITTMTSCTIDLNGHTLSTGNLERAFTMPVEVTVNIKNGKILTPGNNGNLEYFFRLDELHMKHFLNIENVDFTVSAKTVKSFFSEYYANGTFTIKDCTFDFSSSANDGTTSLALTSVPNTTGGSFTDVSIISSTVIGNNNNTVFEIGNSSYGSSNIKLYDSTFKNSKALFSAPNGSNGKEKVQIFGSRFENFGFLTSEELLPRIEIDQNNDIQDLDGKYTDITHDLTAFKTICYHSYNGATCVSPETCKYCFKQNGETPSGHKSDGGVVTREADCYYSEITTYSCTECGEVLKEEETAPIKGHNFSCEFLGEQTCTTMRYYKYTCVDCDYYYTDAADTDISGAFAYSGHIIDESIPVEPFSSCTGNTGYYYTCKNCGKSDCKYVTHVALHDVYASSFTPADGGNNGSITYTCKTCFYSTTETFTSSQYVATLDGVQYVDKNNCYFTPAIVSDDFMYFVDEDGNKYGADECIKLTKDLTLTTVTYDKHEHIPDESADKKVVPPTCGKDGYTEYSCAICTKTFKADYVEPTGKHTAKAGFDKVVDSTCKVKGYTEHTCDVCSTVYKDTYTDIDPDAHTPKVLKAQDPTCSKVGLTEGSQCSDCNKILVAQEEIPKTAHTPVVDKAVEATCSQTGLTQGSHCEVCDEIIVEQEIVPTVDHIEVIDFARNATCSQTGLTQGSHCKVCNKVLVEQVESPKKSHVIVVDKGYAATCSETGLSNGKHCSICGEITLAQEEIPKLSHTVSPVWETVKQATETEEGERIKKCLICGEVMQTETLPKLDPPVCVHTTVIKNFKAATYFAAGYSGDTVCIKCGVTTSKGVVTAQLKLAKPKFTAKKKGKHIKVTYKKVAGVNKIQIRYRIKGKWKIKTVNAKKKTVTKMLKKLKKGTYKVQIRTMVVSGSQKVYSKWSKVQKVKI